MVIVSDGVIEGSFTTMQGAFSDQLNVGCDQAVRFFTDASFS